ncbi:hypothetical protein J4Q44_G00220950 [Coregonus suidteri]|uniref:Uncharacterized protein n=1 Tax=Coregonus suidteri TaxID=861788 RepID=A0AAN8L7M0_9TELE
MPNKGKKDKESSKSVKSSKSGCKNGHSNSDHEGSNKKSAQPPTTQLLRVKPETCCQEGAEAECFCLPHQHQ